MFPHGHITRYLFGFCWHQANVVAHIDGARCPSDWLMHPLQRYVVHICCTLQSVGNARRQADRLLVSQQCVASLLPDACAESIAAHRGVASASHNCILCLTNRAGLHRAQPLLQSLELGTRQTPTGYRAIKSQRSMATASTDGEDVRASSQPPATAAQQLQQQPPAQVMQQPAPMLQQAPRARKRSATMAAAEAVAAEAPASKRSKPTAR